MAMTNSSRDGFRRTLPFLGGVSVGFFVAMVVCTAFSALLVNVKIILYGITAMASYILPHYKDPASLALFCALLTLIGVSGCFSWALFGAGMERAFKSRRKLLNGVMALLLVYCAAALFL